MVTDVTATLPSVTPSKNAETRMVTDVTTLHTQSLRDAKISDEVTRDCIQKDGVLGEVAVTSVTMGVTPTSEPTKDGCNVSNVCNVGDRVKITEDYPGSETFRGAEGTVKQYSGKGYFEIEFDAEIEVIGGNPKKILNVSSNYFLTVVPALTTAKTQPAEFAEQIRKAIANVDRGLANKVTRTLKDKLQLRAEVRAALSVEEFDNFRLLVTAGFVKGMRVKYVGDPNYAEQYEGLELEVYSIIDKHSLINCRKPDGYLTTWMKPEELQKL
jgi:hypothetical protein